MFPVVPKQHTEWLLGAQLMMRCGAKNPKLRLRLKIVSEVPFVGMLVAIAGCRANLRSLDLQWFLTCVCYRLPKVQLSELKIVKSCALSRTCGKLKAVRELTGVRSCRTVLSLESQQQMLVS